MMLSKSHNTGPTAVALIGEKHLSITIYAESKHPHLAKGVPVNDTLDKSPGETPPCEAAGEKSYLRSALQLVGEPSVPLEVGAFEVSESEGLRARDRTIPLSFDFTFRGIPFTVRVDSGEGGTLSLTGALGALPFTAQSGAGRKYLQTLIQSTGKLNSGRIALTEKGDILLETETSPPVPRTPVSVMASVVALLLETKPYLEAITEVLGLSQPPPAATS